MKTKSRKKTAKRITVADIRKVLPLVAKVPDKKRIKGVMRSLNGRRCASSWCLLKLGYPKVDYMGWRKFTTPRAGKMLRDMAYEWDRLGVWPS